MQPSLKKMATFLSLYVLWGFAFSIGIFPLNGQAADAVVVDRIVAVVNDDLITLFDLNQNFRPYEANIKALGYAPEKERETLFKLRTDLLNQLIERKLSDQVVKKNNIEVSEQEIDTALERLKDARSLTDDDLRTGLARQGLTLEEYRKNLKQQLLRNKLVNREVKSKIVITEDDINAYYDAHREKFAGELNYHLWNIFIRTPEFADDSTKRIALEKMEAVLTQLRQGRSFESFAVDDPDSPIAPKGADLGQFKLDELSPELREAVSGMKAGDFSPILKTDMGYQIIFVQKIVEAKSKSLAAVKSEIHEILYNEAVDNRFQKWLKDLRKKSHIKIIK
ncbi:MAG: SurA N-terminal domain-containing protein [Desulfobacterales bacterium]|jgi:peptidyl-prolyl cis-trans isomerase SurA